MGGELRVWKFCFSTFLGLYYFLRWTGNRTFGVVEANGITQQNGGAAQIYVYNPMIAIRKRYNFVLLNSL